MWKKLVQIVFGKDCELRERMLRTIILVGGLATVIACTEIFMVMEVTNILLPMLFLLLLAMGASFVATFKFRKFDLAAILLGICIVGIAMPVMFVLSGAIESGASIWLTLGILYIFIMFTGKRLVIFLILSFAAYGIAYLTSYYYPELIVPMPSRAIVYIDSFFSLFAVGLVAGIILKTHMKVFEKEHKLNIEQNEELERVSNSKNVFFANMSHEIRTPINAIIGLNEMILRDNPSGDTHEYAKDIQVASSMLLNQVNDILDLSQMEMDKMKIIPVNYQTKEMLGDLAELIHVQIQKKGLELHLDIDENLPSVLMGDEKRIRQILLNILDNAVKYTQEGSVTLSVEGENYSSDEVTLKIKVADTGIGIRKENLASIYDSFNRFDEKKNKRILGNGLGLAITKQLINLMDGDITVDSIYTKGTIFTVILKQQIVDATPIGADQFIGRKPEEGVSYKPLFEAPEARILVVDDSKMNRMVASRLLSSTKVQIDTAGSGTECLELTRKKFYHVILLDYMMPDMNGEETLKAVRGQENGLCRETAVIVLTGNVLSGAREQYMDQGFDGYVEKPIQGRLLEQEISKFLPPDIIEYQEEEQQGTEKPAQMQMMSKRKRKKVYVTTDCTCDIPAELLEKYDIKLMYLYIKTPYGRFADTREIDSDSLEQYVTLENSTARGDSVTVEEFEEFFAEALTQAEEVVHISLASRCGKSNSVAVAAAKCFGHVRVIDSGQISCGQGLVTLHAAKMAQDGKSADEICKEVLKYAEKVQTRFIMPSADIFYQNGRTTALIAKVCKALQLHPYAGLEQKTAVLRGFFGGSLESAWRVGIYWMLRKKRRINTDVVFIAHVGCSVKQQEWIKNEIAKHVKFDKVIMQKASFTSACNVGMETIGISYFMQ